MKKRAAVLVLLIALGTGLWAEKLVFKHTRGEKYRIKTMVQEEVYLNGAFHHSAEILNKISVEVTDVRDGAGYLSATFQTSERRSGATEVFALTEHYHSEFRRDPQGRYEISPHYFMPVVRDVPVFPAGPVAPGDTWVAEGSEAHDFRRSGILDPLTFPITVAYEYVRTETRNDRSVALINIRYTVFHRMEFAQRPADFDPVLITGYSQQRYWFDIDLGKPALYEEQFDFIFHLSSGGAVEYRGTASGELVESPELDRRAVAEQIKSIIQKEKIRDATVDIGEKGVTITLENIQFPPDSAYLVAEEKEKIRKIGEIIAGYDRDILITGHTARVGTEESCQILSEQRARAVGEHLLTLGAKRDGEIVFRGMGSREPTGNNATEEGRQKNRRVQITIMEN